MNARNVLLVDRPGDFRDALVRAVESGGGRAHATDDAMDALARFREVAPNVVVVSEDPGPPGGASLCRILGRRLDGAAVYRLGDPASRDAHDGATAVFPRSLGADALAKALLDDRGRGPDSIEASAPWEAPVGNLELGALLVGIAERWLTGRLVLSTGSSEREIWFVRGMIVFAQSSTFTERLGAVGVRRSLLLPTQVDQAMDLARNAGLRIGEALIELEMIDGYGLYELLAAQLIEQVATAINSRECKARLFIDSDVASRSILLRLHPLTALLAAVERTPAGHVARVIEIMAERMIAPFPVIGVVDRWLRDLGVADSSQVLSGPLCVRELRDRIGSILSSDVEVGGAGLRRSVLPPEEGKSRADAITLALLRSGALTIHGGAPEAPTSITAASSLSPTSIVAAIERAGVRRFEGWPSPPIRPPASDLDRAVDEYLHGARPSDVAEAAALRGPGPEASDPQHELLALYLRIKPLVEPRAVLDVGSNAGRREVRLAYYGLAKRLDGISEGAYAAFVRCRIAEVRAKLDTAVDAVLPGEAHPSLDRPPLTSIAPSKPHSRESDPEIVAGRAARLGPRSSDPEIPAPPRAPSSIPPPLPPSEAQKRDAAWTPGFADVEPLLRTGAWEAVRAALEKREPDPQKLPPTLALLYAVSLKEAPKAREPGKTSKTGIDADTLGIHAVGLLLGVPDDSATALVLAKRALRRRPIEWDEKPPARVSILLLVIALAIGAGVGLLLSPGGLSLPW